MKLYHWKFIFDNEFFYRTKNLLNYCNDSLCMNFYVFVIFSLSLSLFLFVIPINSWQFGGNEHLLIGILLN